MSDVALLTPDLALIDLSALNYGKIFRVTLGKLSAEDSKGKIRLGTHLYPNPTSGNLTIRKWYTHEGDVRIVDLFGRTVMLARIKPEPGSSTIDCRSLPNGTYTIVMKHHGEGLPIGRFILMK